MTAAARRPASSVYVNGQLQPVTVTNDTLRGTIRTKVPLKVGQRHTADRVKNVAVEDVRLYGRALSAAEAVRLAQTPRAMELLAKPAAKRTAQGARRAVRLVPGNDG